MRRPRYSAQEPVLIHLAMECLRLLQAALQRRRLEGAAPNWCHAPMQRCQESRQPAVGRGTRLLLHRNNSQRAFRKVLSLDTNICCTALNTLLATLPYEDTCTISWYS